MREVNVSRAGGNTVSRNAYKHVAAELKRPNLCTENGQSNLWAWGTAITARDKRDALTVVLIHNGMRSSEVQFSCEWG